MNNSTWNWPRWRGVVVGAATVAGAYCLTEANMTPGHVNWKTGARAAPFSVCLKRDSPRIFLVAAGVLTWISRNKTGSRE